MAEEAREAALATEREKFMDPPAESRVFVNAHLTGFGIGWDAGHAAGVAEGIRQAREAVEAARYDTGIYQTEEAPGVVAALFAIDALETA